MILHTRLWIIGLSILSMCAATKPPGYVEKAKPHDPHPPNYDYSYSVADHSGGQQGHLEKRNGEHTEGRYFVDDPKESSSQEVRYSADDWGFHPLVKYSSKTPTGHYSARFALGEQAVKEFSLEQNAAKGTTPIAPLLAGTVLPAGTSTDGFIHHDNINGVRTLHTMAVQPIGSSINVQPQQSAIDPGHQDVLRLVPVLPTIPQQSFIHEPEPLTTVLSPVQRDFNYIQNINSLPNGNVKYYSNVNGHNSKSRINVELGPIGPPITNSLEESDKINNGRSPVEQLQKDYDDSSDDNEDKLPIPQELISESINAGITGYDSETIDLQNNGGFGSRIHSSSKPISISKSNVSIKKPQNTFYVTTQRPQPSTTKKAVIDYNNRQQYTRLVESTQNLVSNEDLLNINGAVEPYFVNRDVKIDESIYFPYPQQQNVVTIKPSPTVLTLQGTVRFANDGGIKKPSGAGIISIEHEGQYRNTHGDVFKSPIVVADFDHSNNLATSTQQSPINVGNIYSTTQSTIDTGTSNLFQYVPIQGQTNEPSSTTILVTPRPVSQKFLAPLNAGLTLVTTNNVEKFLDCTNSTSSSDVKEVEDEVIEQENMENNALKTVVELFKSVSLDTVNNIDDSRNDTFNQANQLAQNIQSQINTNNLQQYPSALEDSKRIQQTSSQQLYQYGAQQVLIHPAEQQNQLAAEELHQQLEESNEESIKQQTINNNQYVQRGVDKDQVVLHYPASEPLTSAQPFVQPNVIYQYNNDHKAPHSIVQVQTGPNGGHNGAHGASYSISVQHDNHAQSVTSHVQHSSKVVQNNHPQHYEPALLQSQQYLVYGAPQNLQYSQQVSQNSYNDEKQNTLVPYVSSYHNTNSVPYPISHQNKLSQQLVDETKYLERPYAVPQHVHHPYIIENNIPYALPVQQKVEHKVPVEVKVPYQVTQYVEKPYPVQKPVPYPVTVEKVVEKKVPYPVEVKVPIKIEVPKPYPVEKIVEKPIEVTKYVNRPYPVEKLVPYPVEVDKIVEKKVPYPVEVQVPYKIEYSKQIPYPVEKLVEKPYSLPVAVQVPYIAAPYAVAYSGHAQQSNQQAYSTGQNTFLPNAWAIGYNLNQQFFNNIQHPNQPIKHSEPTKYPPIADSYYRKNLGPYGQSHTYNPQTTYLYSLSDHSAQASQNVNNYHKFASSSKPSNDYWNLKNNFHQTSHVNQHNTHSFSSVGARNINHNSNLHNTHNYLSPNPHFRYKKEREAKGLRVEYGFKPPLVPSLEIDMEGRPVKREKP